MQTPAHLQHTFTTAHMIYSAVFGSAAGVTAGKYLSKIVKAMPPLPANATWMQRWAYAALQNITEVEPAGKP